MRWKVGLLTASDKGYRGEREDTSAQVIRELVDEELYGDIVDYRIVPDEIQEIMAALIEMTEYYQPQLILTTGGIGLSPRDVTPEATMQVIDRQCPGFPEAMRSALRAKGRNSLSSRAVAGVRGRSLIVNLPGTPEGVHECLAAILEQLPEVLHELSEW